MSCHRRARCPETGQVREGRDSNPGGSLTPPTRLAGERFRPLSHLPATGSGKLYPPACGRPAQLEMKEAEPAGAPPPLCRPGSLLRGDRLQGLLDAVAHALE